MNKIIRHQIADYLNIAAGDAPEYALMGAGFTALDENPNAQVETSAYISDKCASGSVTGYENSFAFDTQMISDDAAVAFIYGVARNQKTGADAETDYVRVELFGGGNAVYPARRFRVAVAVEDITGEGTKIVRIAGRLVQVGSFAEGSFNVSTKTFTPAQAA